MLKRPTSYYHSNNQDHAMNIALGIHTGGTYTDAALIDQESGKVLAGAKSLTTRHDLSLGITGAMEDVLSHDSRFFPLHYRRTLSQTLRWISQKGSGIHRLFSQWRSYLCYRSASPLCPILCRTHPIFFGSCLLVDCSRILHTIFISVRSHGSPVCWL